MNLIDKDGEGTDMNGFRHKQRGSAALFLVAALVMGGMAYAGLREDSPASPAAGVVQQLAQAWANDAGNVRIALSAKQTELVIGVDDMQLELTSERPGYLTLLAAGSDGTSLYALLPAKGQSLSVTVGQTALPPPQLRIATSGPAGIGAVMAIVSDNPQDADALLAQLKQNGRLDIAGPHGISVLLYRERAQR